MGGERRTKVEEEKMVGREKDEDERGTRRGQDRRVVNRSKAEDGGERGGRRGGKKRKK